MNSNLIELDLRCQSRELSSFPLEAAWNKKIMEKKLQKLKSWNSGALTSLQRVGEVESIFRKVPYDRELLTRAFASEMRWNTVW